MDDCAIITLPTTKADILKAIDGLKIARLLNGYRGQGKGDIAALVDAIASAADFVIAHAADIEELDINPLMVQPEGQGVVAADALRVHAFDLRSHADLLFSPTRGEVRVPQAPPVNEARRAPRIYLSP
eukprot:gene53809-73596_t